MVDVPVCIPVSETPACAHSAPPDEPESEICSICLDELSACATGNSACVTLPCKHVFHAECMIRFARSKSVNHRTCPVCRDAEEEVDSEEVAAEELTNEEIADNERYEAQAQEEYVSGQSLVDRARGLAENGEGSSVLRRYVRTLKTSSDGKHAANKELARFRKQNPRIFRQYGAMKKKYAAAKTRQLIAKSALVHHMRAGELDA